jgi:hypothetical protein
MVISGGQTIIDGNTVFFVKQLRYWISPTARGAPLGIQRIGTDEYVLDIMIV